MSWKSQDEYEATHGTQDQQAARQVRARAEVEYWPDGSPALWRLVRLRFCAVEPIVRDNSIRSTRWEAERDADAAQRETGICWSVERVDRPEAAPRL